MLATEGFSEFETKFRKRGSARTAEQAAEKCNKKKLPQGLKPIGSTRFTSGLKHRPPEEKCNRTRKGFLQGLKPVESTQLMSGLKSLRENRGKCPQRLKPC